MWALEVLGAMSNVVRYEVDSVEDYVAMVEELPNGQEGTIIVEKTGCMPRNLRLYSDGDSLH